MTVSRELSKYRLDVVGLQEIGWEGGGTKPAREYKFFYGRGKSESRIRYRFLCT
jgi:hypothetical protein